MAGKKSAKSNSKTKTSRSKSSKKKAKSNTKTKLNSSSTKKTLRNIRSSKIKISNSKNKQTEKKQGFFEKNIMLSLEYITESRKVIYFALFLFVFSTLLGYFQFQAHLFEEVIEQFLKKLISETQDLGTSGLIVFILENNIQSAFIGLISGILLGIFPLFTLFINGYFLGYVSFFAVGLQGEAILLRLLPHGIFELPALIISLALGIRFGLFVFSKNAKKEFLYRLDRSLRVFLFIILPLLIIAGVIEGLLIGLIG